MHSVRESVAYRHVKKFVVGFAATMVFLGMGVAVASWTQSTSNNHAAAKYGTLAGVTGVSFTPSAAGTMLPGGNGDLYLKAVNTNAQSVTLVSIDGGSATFSGCTTPAASLVNFDSGSLYTNGGAGWTIAPGTTSDILVKANGVHIGAGASNDCQGATLDVATLSFSTST